MKTLLILLLLCWLSSADGLNCYVCSSTTTNSQCNQNTASCQAPLDTCMNTVVTAGNVMAIVKQCSSANICSAAASVSSATNSGTTTITCCNSDLCNYSGATTASLHSLLLALPLCAIYALRYISA
ncbi:lymphocyte antigen 6B-like isoform X2 [Brienomyrus brachyistius]|uniref:lymphocyte antigen 6B-like isoform X2 n=1 Tax=Brienomyrus brachyistius TaxID=42636 RepID=UPI0020B1EAC1|nr:lymphocyte antigen 6B-like isoform X2 [Brienomyrus brachyistius]